MNLNRVYKYIRSDSSGEFDQHFQLMIRFEMGEWMLTLVHPKMGVFKYEWFQTSEHWDETEVQTLLRDFLLSYTQSTESVNLIICGEKFQIFPAGFSTDNEVALQSIFPYSDFEVLHIESIAAQKLEIVYAIPRSLLHVLQEFWPSHKITHQATVFYHEQENSISREAVHVCVYNSYVLLHATVNYETFILKRISFDSKEDLLFEILSIYKHFSMKPEEIPLFVGGMIDKDSALFRLLRQYIRDVEIQKFESIELIHDLPDLFENHLIEKV